MTLRGIPGALALGLLASLIAHAALYGGGHTMGGAYHELLVQLAAAGCLGFGVAFGALAWNGGRHRVDGSVLAARLRARMPGLGQLSLAAALWFTLGERIEPQHADAGLALTAASVIAASIALLALVRWGVRLLAAAIVEMMDEAYAARELGWVRYFEPALRVHSHARVGRQFTRPPPNANARA
ncbi:MAG: hypothetical protein JOY69_01060 [Candidatus Eremiobacteraeota bacterium]|nr:hypothetical protein [Candidatus Eremiobacteraeota bacterium]MBV8371823.1 hypothetical protein [Candidatus Eremiobacteraeota bacterium]